MIRPLILVFAVLLSLCPAGAVSPETWRQSEFADFEKATLKKVSLRSDGRLSLAPVFTELLDASLPYLWALAEDSKGNVYAGGGGPGAPGARVFVISPEGKSRVLVELDALEVHALAVDRSDRLYAATSPDARIYRVAADGKAELYYDPAAKYVWAMAFDAAGNLYVATGDQGLVHRVTPDGKGAVLYRTEENHARSLAIDGKGNLIVGTEPDGLVVRVSPAGQGFVLYETPKREVTAVAVAADGTIYAAGVGAKQPAVAPAVPAAPVTAVQPAAAAQAQAAAQPQQTPPPQPPPTMAPAQILLAGGSEVYRIEPDGYARKVWAHAQDIVYSLAVDGQNRPLVGAGNKGNIYRVESGVLQTLLVTASPSQVTGLLAGRQGRILAATGNVGKVFSLGPGLEKEGSVESDVFDAELFSLWGRLSFTGTPAGGGLRFETRSGNLDRPRQDWSPWAEVKLESDGGRVASPQARFLQWRLSLTGSASGASPQVDAVSVAYLAKNVPPVVQEIEITAANYRFPTQSLLITPTRTLTLQPLGRPRRTPSVPMADSGMVTLQYDKGQLGARWAASDENGDGLLYRAEIRGVQESEWRLLKDKIKEKYVSWDSTAFSDGEYVLRVTATDLPDNPPGEELSAQLVSRPFLIDNSPPRITGPTATRASGGLEVRWKSVDAHSLVARAEYSLDGGDWLVAQPTTRVSDSQEHDYALKLESVPAGEHTIAVRVTDDYDNQAVAQVLVK